MKILITGGAGFIGSAVIERLTSEHHIKKVIVLDNLLDGSYKNIKRFIDKKKFFFFKRDINNINSIKNLFYNVDCVIHLAALSDIVPSIVSPTKYLQTNIMGTVNVLESMRKHGVKKMVYAASSSCYGIPKKFPTSENEKIDPKYPYAFSKYIGEQTIIHWSKVYKINFISLRLFNVYGLRSRTHGAYGAALGIFLKQKISNKAFTVVGTGKQKRDFVNSIDVADAFVKSIFITNKRLVLNIGSSLPKSINTMLNILKGKKIFIPNRPGEPFKTHANINKAISILKWKPRINFADGIKQVMDNISYWKDSPLWNRKNIKKATKDWFRYLSK
jgi:UDP-glucose 4-epimerase